MCHDYPILWTVSTSWWHPWKNLDSCRANKDLHSCPCAFKLRKRTNALQIRNSPERITNLTKTGIDLSKLTEFTKYLSCDSTFPARQINWRGYTAHLAIQDGSLSAMAMHHKKLITKVEDALTQLLGQGDTLNLWIRGRIFCLLTLGCRFITVLMVASTIYCIYTKKWDMLACNLTTCPQLWSPMPFRIRKEPCNLLGLCFA